MVKNGTRGRHSRRSEPTERSETAKGGHYRRSDATGFKDSGSLETAVRHRKIGRFRNCRRIGTALRSEVED